MKIEIPYIVVWIILYLVMARFFARCKNPYLGLIMPVLPILGALFFLVIPDINPTFLSASKCALYMTFLLGLACIGYFIFGYEKLQLINRTEQVIEHEKTPDQ